MEPAVSPTNLTIDLQNLASGLYQVVLNVVDNMGMSSAESKAIYVNSDDGTSTGGGSDPIAYMQASYSYTDRALLLNAFGSLPSSSGDGFIVEYKYYAQNRTTGEVLQGSSQNPMIQIYGANFGVWDISLTVVNNDMRESAPFFTLLNTNDYVPAVQVIANLTCWSTGLLISCDASASSSNVGPITQYNVYMDGVSQTFSSPFFSLQASSPGEKYVDLSVIDSLGNVSSSRIFTINIVMSYPVATMNCTFVEGRINCNAGASYDPDGSINSYQLLVDGETVSSSTPEISAPIRSEGVKAVTLTVTDNDLLSSSQTIQVEAFFVLDPNSNPICFRNENKTISCDGRDSSGHHSTITNYSWTINGQPASNEAQFNFPDDNIEYVIALQVTDSNGRQGTDQIILSIVEEEAESSDVKIIVFYPFAEYSYSLDDQYIRFQIIKSELLTDKGVSLRLNNSFLAESSVNIVNGFIDIPTNLMIDGINVFEFIGLDSNGQQIESTIELALGTAQVNLLTGAVFDLVHVMDNRIRFESVQSLAGKKIPSGKYVVLRKNENNITPRMIDVLPGKINDISFGDGAVSITEGNLDFSKGLEGWYVSSTNSSIVNEYSSRSEKQENKLSFGPGPDGKVNLRRYFKAQGSMPHYMTSLTVSLGNSTGRFYALIKNLTQNKFEIMARTFTSNEQLDLDLYIDKTLNDTIGLDVYFEFDEKQLVHMNTLEIPTFIEKAYAQGDQPFTPIKISKLQETVFKDFRIVTPKVTGQGVAYESDISGLSVDDNYLIKNFNWEDKFYKEETVLTGFPLVPKKTGRNFLRLRDIIIRDDLIDYFKNAKLELKLEFYRDNFNPLISKKVLAKSSGTLMRDVVDVYIDPLLTDLTLNEGYNYLNIYLCMSGIPGVELECKKFQKWNREIEMGYVFNWIEVPFEYLQFAGADDFDQGGDKWFARSLVSEVYGLLARRLAINDLSFINGGKNREHGGHEFGRTVDFLVSDNVVGNQLKLNERDFGALDELIFSFGKRINIIYGPKKDSVGVGPILNAKIDEFYNRIHSKCYSNGLSGKKFLEQWKGHHNHFHIDFREDERKLPQMDLEGSVNISFNEQVVDYYNGVGTKKLKVKEIGFEPSSLRALLMTSVDIYSRSKLVSTEGLRFEGNLQEFADKYKNKDLSYDKSYLFVFNGDDNYRCASFTFTPDMGTIIKKTIYALPPEAEALTLGGNRIELKMETTNGAKLECLQPNCVYPVQFGPQYDVDYKLNVPITTSNASFKTNAIYENKTIWKSPITSFSIEPEENILGGIVYKLQVTPIDLDLPLIKYLEPGNLLAYSMLLKNQEKMWSGTGGNYSTFSFACPAWASEYDRAIESVTFYAAQNGGLTFSTPEPKVISNPNSCENP